MDQQQQQPSQKQFEVLKSQQQLSPLDSTNVKKRSCQQYIKSFVSIQIINLYFFLLLFYLPYLIVTSIRGNKKSIAILLITNLYHYMFSKRNAQLAKVIQNAEQWFKNFQVICEEPVDSQGCLLPIHPHHIVCYGATFAVNNQSSPLYLMPLLASRLITDIAPHGILIKGWGIQAVKSSNFSQMLKEKKTFCFIPGGFEEATMTSHKEYRVFLKNRKGFIKYGLQNGVKLHPVFVFNENKCFKTVDNFMKLRLLINKLKIPAVIFFSKYGIVPDPTVEIFVVVGKGMQLPLIPHPTNDEINQYHTNYIEHVIQFFDRSSPMYDPGSNLSIY